MRSTLARRAIAHNNGPRDPRTRRPASATTETFNFTGAAQTWTVPAGLTEATFDLYGAQGGGIPGDPLFLPGLGGRATATIAVTPGASIQVNVGGQGGIFGGGGGFNGGGGGASDIRIGGTALTDRVLVAGGGGGSGNDVCRAPPNPNSAESEVMAADCQV
jgi:hypothetical protein